MIFYQAKFGATKFYTKPVCTQFYLKKLKLSLILDFYSKVVKSINTKFQIEESKSSLSGLCINLKTILVLRTNPYSPPLFLQAFWPHAVFTEILPNTVKIYIFLWFPRPRSRRGNPFLLLKSYHSIRSIARAGEYFGDFFKVLLYFL